MPLCHGAGELAVHYRFGTRTAGSSPMVGTLLLLLTVLFGNSLLGFLYLLPMAILGVLLVFGGGQLDLTVVDVNTQEFVRGTANGGHHPGQQPGSRLYRRHRRGLPAAIRSPVGVEKP